MHWEVLAVHAFSFWILLNVCLHAALWVFISQYFKSQSPKLVMNIKAALVLHFCLFKTAPSVLVWHFNMSPDPKASHYTRLADLTLLQLMPVRIFVLPGTLIILEKAGSHPYMCLSQTTQFIWQCGHENHSDRLFFFSHLSHFLYFNNMSPRVAICMQLLPLYVCMWVIKLPSNRAEKGVHTLIYVSRQKYEIELMCCWFMWMHKTPGEHIWWKLEIHWKTETWS